MNMAIIGPGAVGLLLAGFLKRAGAELMLVDYRPDRAERLNSSEICWEGIDGKEAFHIPVECGMKDPQKHDIVIVCVKAYHTEDAAKELKRAKYSGPVLTLQNGLGNVEILRKYLPDADLIAGITSEGANIVDAGHVRHAGKGKTSLGPVVPGKPGDKFLNQLLDLMKSAGLNTEIVSEPESLIWGKLLINVGINALTAIFNVQNGKLLENSHSRSLMSDLVLEGWDLTKKRGITIPYTDPVERVEEVCRMTSENYSSMYQDMKFGRQTEIDFINGAIVKEGKSVGHPCPCNEFVTKIIHGLEKARTNC